MSENVPTLDESVADNYRQLKAETGRTWPEMAEQFDRDADQLPPEHAAPYRSLATWARAQSEPDAEPDAEPTEPTTPRKRTTTEKKPTRAG